MLLVMQLLIHKPMSITTFADQLQLDLGALSADSDVSNWLSGWAAREGTQAANNPLACTVLMPGSTYFNCLRGCPNNLPCPTCTFGVQNYLTERDGAQATALNLKEPGHGYEPLVSAIALHDKTALGIYGSPSQAIIDALNHWCGCGYGAQAGSFSGGGSVTPQSTVTSSGQKPCDNGFSWGCVACNLIHPTDYISQCYTNYAGTNPGNNGTGPLPQYIINIFSSPTNLLKFVLGLGVFIVGLGLVFEIISQQPVIAPALSGAKKAIGGGAALL